MIKWICGGCGAIYGGWAAGYNPCPKCGKTMEPLERRVVNTSVWSGEKRSTGLKDCSCCKDNS